MQILPGDFGEPAANYQGRYLTSAVNGQYMGELSVQVNLDTWYTIYVQPCTVGRYRAVDNGDDTFSVVTEGGLIGSQNVNMSNLQVTFDNISVDVEANNYDGGWQVNWVTNRISGNHTMVLPKNVLSGSYWLFWGHSGQGNTMHFTIDADGFVEMVDCNRDLIFVGLIEKLFFPESQQVTFQLPDAIADTALNWWAVDGGGNIRGSKGDGFADVTCNLLAGNYNLFGDAGFPGIVFSIPTDTTDWIQTADQTWPDPVGTLTWTAVGPQSPSLDGDANGDCKVNIIDLIFIRNRLNKDVTTDDNALADVNSDGKVNIIDLIYVRNRLNNKCE